MKEKKGVTSLGEWRVCKPGSLVVGGEASKSRSFRLVTRRVDKKISRRETPGKVGNKAE